MTYIDKYMELHPDADKASVMRRRCPNGDAFDIPSEPGSYCAFEDLSGGVDDCEMCWQRTYRGEEEMVDED